MPGPMAPRRQVALLRGVNIGPRNRIAMAQLRALMEDLGHADVRTHLVSGNAVFTSDADPAQVEADMETALAERLGMRIRVLVRSAEELAEVVAGNALLAHATDQARLLVLFLSAAPEPPRLDGIDPQRFAPERFHVGHREIYLWCANGFHESRLTQTFSERRLGVTVTARNWNTVTRLLELARA
jgi:uncharacterized protein (DUF1697 family)